MGYSHSAYNTTSLLKSSINHQNYHQNYLVLQICIQPTLCLFFLLFLLLLCSSFAFLVVHFSASSLSACFCSTSFFDVFLTLTDCSSMALSLTSSIFLFLVLF